MRNLLDTAKCQHWFDPSFDNKECTWYLYAEDEKMQPRDGECGYCKHPEGYRCEADITRSIPLSHSSSGDFGTCHYLYYLKKLRGIEMRPAYLSRPLKAGTLWDKVKQKHLGAAINIQAIIDEYEIDPMTVAKVKAVYRAYRELEIEVDEGYDLQAKIDLEFPVIIPACSFIPNIKVGTEDVNIWAITKDLEGDTRNWTFPLYVSGFYDRKYPGYFSEDKLSGRPENYLDPFFIQSQNGTYFLADPSLEYCIMEVVRMPQLKELKANKTRDDETPDQMYNRCLQDILSRPSYYFQGWDKSKRRYGKRFYRSEFDLHEIEARYKQMVIEIKAAQWSGNWYKNWKVCGNVFPGIACDMYDVCKTGNMSEVIFKIRGKG